MAVIPEISTRRGPFYGVCATAEIERLFEAERLIVLVKEGVLNGWLVTIGLNGARLLSPIVVGEDGLFTREVHDFLGNPVVRFVDDTIPALNEWVIQHNPALVLGMEPAITESILSDSPLR